MKTNERKEESFDIQKWRENRAKKRTILPKSHFPDSSNHPFFKRKFERALERAAEYLEDSRGK